MEAVVEAIGVLEKTPFEVLESLGYHLTKRHFYSPIPDVHDLASISPDHWGVAKSLPGIEMNEGKQLALLRTFSRFRAEYECWPGEPTGLPYDFHFNNGCFDGTDAMVLHCMIRHLRPRKVIEVGGGYSTFVSAAAARSNGDTQLITVEPYPSPVLAKGFPGLSMLMQERAERLAIPFYQRLEAGDILFIDSSHTVKTGSDVNFLILEVLPRLKAGVYVHLHDIFLPREYPRRWVIEMHLFWSEMYLLQAFLAYNKVFDIVFANHFMGLRHRERMRAVFPPGPWHGGGSFWIRKRC